MRIAHVIASLDPSMGGLPKSAVAQAAAQSQLGHEVSLLYGERNSSPEILRDTYGHFPGFDRIHFFPLQVQGLRKLWPKGFHDRLSQVNPEVLHTHGLWEPLLAHAQRFGLTQKIPYIVFPQSMLHPWQAKNNRMAKWVLMHVLGWKTRWRQAAFIQVLSEDEAHHWQALGISKTRHIPNGIFPSEDPGPQEGLLYPWLKHPFLLSLARLHPQKSPDVLLDAFARITEEYPTLCLVLAGPDYGMKASLEKQREDLGLQGRVFLPGSLTGNEKWAALHACRCFCLPSQAEGFSLALLEAALAGAPLVISRECYFDALVQTGAGVMAGVEPEQVAEGIRQVLEQPREIGNAARSLVLENYTWETIALQLIDAYARIKA